MNEDTKYFLISLIIAITFPLMLIVFVCSALCYPVVLLIEKIKGEQNEN